MHVDIASLLDLTDLSDNTNQENINKLCRAAIDNNVAAVCVAAPWLEQCRNELCETEVRLASVANFPAGNSDLAFVQTEIAKLISLGADEIDVVLPYSLLKSGAITEVEQHVAAYRESCGKLTLKVIIESGCLSAMEIAMAADICITHSVDFIKTSTGKVEVGATTQAAEIIADTILLRQAVNHVGIKLSGGIRTVEQADAYLEILNEKFGIAWLSSKNLRIGASSLLQDIIKKR